MKIKDLINKMSNNTGILIYRSEISCAMPSYGDCEGGKVDEYDCRDCECYLEENSEWTVYYGSASDCPIKTAEMTVKEINNAAHRVQTTRRKSIDVHVIAIRV